MEYNKENMDSPHGGMSKMRKVTYFDVEYANSRNKSICQIGLICKNIESGSEYYPSLNLLINPEDSFDSVCMNVHGITSRMVKDQPTFPEVWGTIEKYFTNTVIVGHNVASADLDALTKTLKRYNLDVPELYYVCTLKLAKKYIPKFAVENYRLDTLCNYYDIQRENEHNAYYDALVNESVLCEIIKEYSVDVSDYIEKYEPKGHLEFEQYLSNPMIRKAISEFYGVVRGFSLDNKITKEETDYIHQWREKYQKFSMHREIQKVIEFIDVILQDRIVTVTEMFALQRVLKEYLDIVSTAPVTLATQILNGILEGIILDGEITIEESQSLRLWLYDNIYLSGHYPFDKVIDILERVLEDSVITSDESAQLTDTIQALLNPVETLKQEINSVKDKHVCLSGNFAYGNGKKSDVEQYIKEHGGVVDSSVKKSTDILLIGACECEAYAHGTYGTKVKKAMEYNSKGCSIQIIKEDDFFAQNK